MEASSSASTGAPPEPSVPEAPIFDGVGNEEERTRCEELVESAMRTCPKIRMMREALTRLGRPADAAAVKCTHCPDDVMVSGGYLPSSKAVLLCQQWVAKEPGEVANTIVHEMVHAYDDARAFLDWNDLTQHACTEIRAANLSGDCTFNRELNRGNVHPLNYSGQGSRCVRRRAELSVAMHPGCPDDATAQLAVERAWASCFRDRAPFDDQPRSKLEL